MAKEKYNEEDDVWRTIGGRKVFIRKGQSVADAMIESGKFKGQKNKPGMRESYRQEKEKDYKEQEELYDKYKNAKDENVKDEAHKYMEKVRDNNEKYEDTYEKRKEREDRQEQVDKERGKAEPVREKYREKDIKEDIIDKFDLTGNDFEDFRNEMRYNRGISRKNGMDESVDLDYVIDRLSDIKDPRTKDLLQEMKNNRKINKENDYENRVDMGYIVDRLNELKSTNEKNYREIEKQLLDDYTKVDTDDLKMYRDIFKEQGKNKFAERLDNEISKRENKSTDEKPKRLGGWKINEEGKKEYYERELGDDESGYWTKENGQRVYKENPRYKEKSTNETMNNAIREKASKKDYSNFNDKTTADFGKIDYNGTGRKANKVTIDMQLKDGTFTASGNVWNSKGTDIIAGGQNIDELAEIMKGNKDVQEIHSLWKKYHLNDMHAGTEKQEEALEKYKGEREKIRQELDKKKNEGYKIIHNDVSNYEVDVELLKRHNLYEDNGYKYGSGWLKREIPDEDKERIVNLINKFNGKTETTNETMNNAIRKQANIKNEYKQYLKDHPESKMSLSEFKKKNK